jgi:hypothetical protein
MSATAVAAIASTQKKACGEDVEIIFKIIIFAFDEQTVCQGIFRLFSRDKIIVAHYGCSLAEVSEFEKATRYNFPHAKRYSL